MADETKISEQVANAADAAINETARMAAATAERARTRREQVETMRAAQAAAKGRYATVGGKIGVGAALAVGGCAVLTGVAAGSLAKLALAVLVPGAGLVSGLALLVAAAAGVALVGVGASRIAFSLRFRKYQKAIGAAEHIDVAELARAVGRPESKVVADLHKMLKQGLFLQGHLDANDSCLMTTDECYRHYLNTVRAAQERELDSVLASSVTPQEERMPLSERQREVLEQGQAYVAKIRACNEKIHDAEVSTRVTGIGEVLGSIFERAGEHPEDVGKLQQLMSYYLPQTVKLLDSYIELAAQPVQGEQVQSSQREISSTLATLQRAYEKLLDSMFRDTAWDVSTDIAVLNTVLAQEGLVDAPFGKGTQA